MQKLTRPVRQLLLSAAFTSMLLLATAALMAVHLQGHTAKAACHHAAAAGACRPSPASDRAPARHDHAQCPICQVLLGPAGKYLHLTPPGLGLVIAQPPLTGGTGPTHPAEQSTPGIAVPRAPPAC